MVNKSTAFTFVVVDVINHGIHMISLEGKKGLVFGIANNHSIAYGCAKALVDNGAEVAITYANEAAKKYVMPLADELNVNIFEPCDVTSDEEMAAVFDRVKSEWGSIDFVIHSIAFCPLDDLHGRVLDSKWESVALAMNISCHSFVRMAKLAEPMLNKGASLISISYVGAERVVPDYGIMGPVKAALEASARYMALELAENKIRCNILSPGPIKTRAAGGVKNFNELLEDAKSKSPSGELSTIEDVGNAAAFLISDQSRAINASTLYVDEGFHSLA